jgi:hypothetical protein
MGYYVWAMMIEDDDDLLIINRLLLYSTVIYFLWRCDDHNMWLIHV